MKSCARVTLFCNFGFAGMLLYLVVCTHIMPITIVGQIREKRYTICILSKGSSDFINGLNSDSREYGADVIAGIRGSGGAIQGSGGNGSANGEEYRITDSDGNTHHLHTFDDGSFAVTTFDKNGELKSHIQVNKDGEEEEYIAFDDPDSGGGTKVSDGSDGEVSEGNVITSGARGLVPIEVKDPNKKESGIKIVQTDAGAVYVVDYEQLRDATKAGPEVGMNIWSNPLTNEAVYVTPGEVDPKARFGQFLKQETLNPKINPTR